MTILQILSVNLQNWESFQWKTNHALDSPRDDYHMELGLFFCEVALSPIKFVYCPTTLNNPYMP